MSIRHSLWRRFFIRATWWHRLPGLATVVVLAVFLVPRYRQPRPPLTQDSALFLYSGQRLADGASTYQYVWDIKPPAIHELSGLIAVLVGGNPVLMELLTTALTGAAIIGIATLVTVLASEYGASSIAAVAAGLLILSFPYLFWLASTGIRPKYFALLTGLAGLWYARQDRPLIAMALVTVAPAFWPLALGFSVSGLLIVVDRHQVSARLIGQLGATSAAVTAVIMGPFVITGVTPTLLSQVVATPFLASETATISTRLVDIAHQLHVTTVVVVSGLLGSGLHAYHKRTIQATTPLFLLGWFTIGILLFDFDGAADLIPLWVVSLVGAGLCIQYICFERGPVSLRVEQWMIVAVLTGGVILAAWVVSPASIATRSGGEVANLFWAQEVSTTCHVRLSKPEMAWMNAVGHSTGQSRCDVDWKTVIDLLQ